MRKSANENMNSNFYPKRGSFKNTFCIFKEVELNEIEGLKEQFSSKAGSRYYYSEKGMYRLSNHWGRLANSKWRLIPMENSATSKTKLGFANWNDFFPDNDIDLLYFIEVDFDNYCANYQHKQHSSYDGKAILRNTTETAKVLKRVKNILTLTSWAKFYDEDIDVLRKKIVTELVYTNKSLDEIKREL
jgi:hypothetical protein